MAGTLDPHPDPVPSPPRTPWVPPIPWPISPIRRGSGYDLQVMVRRLEGMAAYRAGERSSVCPYPLDLPLTLDAWCWIDGYVQARGRQWPPPVDPPEENPWGAAWGDTPFG